MRQASKRIPESAEKTVRDIRRATRRHHSAEEKIRIVLEGLRGEDSIAEVCRKEGINSTGLVAWGSSRPRRPLADAAAVPAFSASAQVLSSASLRACSSSVASRWRASATCVPELKFCVYAVSAAAVPARTASAQALSSASLRPSPPTRWRASATCAPPPKFWI